MRQLALLDAAQLTHQECPVPWCGALRLAGQAGPLISCAHDLDPEQRKRPRQCLNRAPDPATAPWPEGY